MCSFSITHAHLFLSGTKKTTTTVGKSKADTAKKETVKKPVWTPEDESARKIQTAARGYLARKELKKLQKEKEEYEELMDKLEKEVNLTFYIKVGNSLFFKYVDKYG